MAFFWKKDTSKEILSRLNEIDSTVKKLDDIYEKEAELIALIVFIQANIDKVEKEILARGIEEKSKPTIDKKYDKEIGKFTSEQISLLRDLSNSLKEYEILAREATDKEDLDSLAEALQEEAEEIKKREESHESLIQNYEEVTLNRRMRNPSDSPPSLKTSDGVAWKKIATVVRQLGGRIENVKGTTHSCRIRFPKAPRPIPLSEDANTGGIANAMRIQLSLIFKSHKIPSKHKLKKALKAGDLRKVV